MPYGPYCLDWGPFYMDFDITADLRYEAIPQIKEAIFSFTY